MALDLGVLAVFKYYAFFVQDVGDVLDAVHLGLPVPLLTIALPVGVSFFTFQAISYTVDVYRRADPARLARSTSPSTSASSRTWWPGRSCARASSCRSWPRRATRPGWPWGRA